MPSQLSAAPPLPAASVQEPLTVPIELPLSIENVRVARGSAPPTEPLLLSITPDGMSWNETTLMGGDIVLHGIQSVSEEQQEGCVYTQLDDGGEIRFIPANSTDINILFRALSAVAVVAEEAVRTEEESQTNGNNDDDDGMYARRPDGSVGVVDFDEFLAADPEIHRYSDAEEIDDKEE